MAGLTVDNPAVWSRVIQSGNILPGDVLSLAAGNYSGDIPAFIDGTAAKPIIIRPRAGASVVFNDGLKILGDYIQFENIEFVYSGWTSRLSEQSGSAPTDIPKNKIMQASGNWISFINCHIHDVPSAWFGGDGGDVVGCHIHSIGWDAPDRGHGHGIYSQNRSPATKRFAYNLIHECYGWGIHIWDEANPLDNYTVEYNVIFGSGSPGVESKPNILHGGQNTVCHNNLHRNNLTYRGRGNEYGYSAGMDTSTLSNNYYPDGIVKANCDITETDNYYGPAVGNQVFVYPYVTGKGYITIYNQAQADSITVDVSSILGVGDDYTLANAQDISTDIVSGTVGEAGTIDIDMRAISHTVTGPIAGTAPATTFPLFGCFVIEAA